MVEQVVEASFFEKLNDTIIWMLIERVDIKPEGAREKSGVLRNDRNGVAQGLQVNPRNVLIIN